MHIECNAHFEAFSKYNQEQDPTNTKAICHPHCPPSRRTATKLVLSFMGRVEIMA